MEDVKSSEDWRREFMTLFLHDKEIERLADRTRVVRLIRKNQSMTAEQMSNVFDVPMDFVLNALSLLQEFPEKGDEDIAEMVMEAME